MDTFIQVLIIGLANGSIFALIALGYTLVYGIIELINFAHGDLFMLGSFMALTMVNLVVEPNHNNPAIVIGGLVLALLIPMVFCAVINITTERLAYRPLRRAPRLAPLISAIGVSFIFINIGLFWKGPNPQNFPDVIPNINLLQPIPFRGSVFFGTKDLFALLAPVPLMLALRWLVNSTKIGKAMRATAQDRDASALMGIDINRTIAFTFLLGGALAGAAGLFFGLYTNTIVFTRGFDAGLKAFTAAVLGGIGNLTGAMLGGFIIGIISALSDQYLNNTWTNAVVFAILIIILVFRPSGLLGEEVPDKA